MRKSAVIVEPRNIEGLVNIINAHLKHLDDTWDLMIFGSVLNRELMKTSFPQARFVSLGGGNINIRGYNTLLTSLDFWKSIPNEKVLIFQWDSMILKKGVDEFLGYDFVGAPWKFSQTGGNGGFSIRSRSAMIKCIEHRKYNPSSDGNEDIYFCKLLKQLNLNLAPRDVCSKFSCETIFALGTFGYHGIDKYLTEEECEQIMTQYGKKVRIDGDTVTLWYGDPDNKYLNTLREHHETLNKCKYVPKIRFVNDRTYTMEYAGVALDKMNGLFPIHKKIIKKQIIELMRFLFEHNLAHRDFHIGHICYNPQKKSIRVIDWDYMGVEEAADMQSLYDVTHAKTGLDSPEETGGMCIFSEHPKSVKSFLKPVEIFLSEFA